MPQLCSVIQWSVHWALNWTTRVLVLAKARRCALEKCRKKKKKASCYLHFVNHMYVDVSCNFISVVVDAEQSKYYQ